MATPADMIAIGDALLGWGFWGGGADENSALANEALRPNSVEGTGVLGFGNPGFYTPADLEAIRQVIARRHGGRWNMVLGDSHVGSGRMADWFDIRRAAVRQRWNRDHLPHAELGL